MRRLGSNIWGVKNRLQKTEEFWMVKTQVRSFGFCYVRFFKSMELPQCQTSNLTSTKLYALQLIKSSKL